MSASPNLNLILNKRCEGPAVSRVSRVFTCVGFYDQLLPAGPEPIPGSPAEAASTRSAVEEPGNAVDP